MKNENRIPRSKVSIEVLAGKTVKIAQHVLVNDIKQNIINVNLILLELSYIYARVCVRVSLDHV